MRLSTLFFQYIFCCKIQMRGNDDERVHVINSARMDMHMRMDLNM